MLRKTSLSPAVPVKPPAAGHSPGCPSPRASAPLFAQTPRSSLPLHVMLGPKIVLITLGPALSPQRWLRLLQHDRQLDAPGARDAPLGVLLAVGFPRGEFDLQKMQFPGRLF